MIFVLILFFCNSCAKEKTVLFDIIDATVSDDWYCTNSIRIENSGFVHILTDCIIEEQKFYTTTLNKNLLDSISDVVNNLFIEKPDTFYNNHCNDCGNFRLIIKLTDKRIETAGIGLGNEKAELFIKYLIKIIRTTVNTHENQLQFESKTMEFYPIPPPSDAVYDINL